MSKKIFFLLALSCCFFKEKESCWINIYSKEFVNGDHSIHWQLCHPVSLLQHPFEKRNYLVSLSISINIFIELPWSLEVTLETADFRMIRKVRLEYLQSVVALIDNCNISLFVNGNTKWPLELTGSVSLLAYLIQVLTV